MTQIESKLEMATFAGGCFWCIESAFAHIEGVIKTVSGLTGGRTPNPSYDQVHTQNTGHLEAVRIWFDPNVVDYTRLLEIFWMQIDPTDPDGQFADRGPAYQTAIFYHNQRQRQLAESSKKQLNDSGIYKQAIVTQIRPAAKFYEAEAYHQEYYKKNPHRYRLYRIGSGREGYINQTWGGNRPKFSFD